MTSADAHSTAHLHARYRQANRIVEEPLPLARVQKGAHMLQHLCVDHQSEDSLSWSHNVMTSVAAWPAAHLWKSEKGGANSSAVACLATHSNDVSRDGRLPDCFSASCNSHVYSYKE